MLIAILHNTRGILAFLLEVAVASLALRRGLAQRLPAFASYSILIVVAEIVRWSAFAEAGPASPLYSHTYWWTQAGLIALRGFVVAEICRRAFGNGEGVWKLCRLILMVVAAVLCAHAIVEDWHVRTISKLVTVAEKDLELAVLGTLVLAFVFARYYRIRIERTIGFVAAGLIFYSAVQVVNSELLHAWLDYYFTYRVIVYNSFAVSMLIWLVAVWNPVPVGSASVASLDPRTYEQVMPEMNLRLRELNDRLLEILR